MKRSYWIAAMTLLALILAMGAPILPAAASDPCEAHQCHNNFECYWEGCFEGCSGGTEATCNVPPASASW